MEEELIYLNDFFDFLEQNGIDASLINVVNCEIDSSQETKGKLIVANNGIILIWIVTQIMDRER